MTATKPETKPLKIVRLEVSNYRGIRALSLDANGNHVIFHGANGSGKTSALDSVWDVLGCISAKDCPEPIHSGELRSTQTIYLGEYIAEKVRTPKSTKIVLKYADGELVPRPGGVIDSFMSKYGSDPDQFLALRPQDQVDELLRFAGVKPPVDAVAKLTGKNHPPRDGEGADAYLMRLSADETGLYYQERREANQRCVQKQGAVAEAKTKLDSLGGPIREDEKAQSAWQLLDRITDLQAQADRRREKQEAWNDAAREHKKGSDKLTERQGEAHRVRLEIVRFEAQLVAMRKDLAEREAKIASSTELVAGLAEDAEAAKAEYDSCPDVNIELAELRAKVGTIETATKTMERRRLLTEQHSGYEDELEAERREHKRLDDVMAGLRDLRIHLLDGLELPIEGLTVDGGPRLHGIPLVQCSRSEQYKLAIAVAAMEDPPPRLRILRLDNCEALDTNSRADVFRFASERGFQCLMACVESSGGLEVEIVEAE